MDDEGAVKGGAPSTASSLRCVADAGKRDSGIETVVYEEVERDAGIEPTPSQLGKPRHELWSRPAGT